LSDQEGNDKVAKVDYEGGIPILRRLSEVERKQDESERHDAEYKREQIRLNRRLVEATVALVVSTVVLGSVQAFYMHRQWKLTSDSLSKMGDQIWAAKNAAYAAKEASNTAAQALQGSQEQFKNTLAQMQAQTTAQQNAANAAQTSSQTTRMALTKVQRAFISTASVDGIRNFASNNELESLQISITMKNSGTTPTKWAVMHFNFEPGLHPMPNNFDFTDKWSGTSHVNVRTVVGAEGTLITSPMIIEAPFVKAVTEGKGTVVIYFWGWVRYRDIFPNTLEHLSEYCFELTGFNGNPFDQNPNASVRMQTASFERHNCYDEECPDYNEKIRGK
jgi:hypothetical protein